MTLHQGFIAIIYFVPLKKWENNLANIFALPQSLRQSPKVIASLLLRVQRKYIERATSGCSA